MSYWSEVTLNEFASSRTETLIEELSKQTEEEEHLKIKKRFSVMRSTDALVEDTYEELKQKIKIGMQIEDYLRDKFENAKASFQYFIDYKNDVFNHVRETTKPKEPQKKERSKKTASKK
ncbi:uncharacterized protein LOC142318200 [Lycorma delicatula]|uniref:uncharacterized protein LOC142318200 n=1 Tax=Lycorma delicatula TaxID=130591 RepID=UPI003F50D94C